ncbi:WD repeat-containing protein 24 [Dinochytrium kinnereticum]|nr:WD repeat-containing protein 24 [Dinochytrium kinnereticum]
MSSAAHGGASESGPGSTTSSSASALSRHHRTPNYMSMSSAGLGSTGSKKKTTMSPSLANPTATPPPPPVKPSRTPSTSSSIGSSAPSESPVTPSPSIAAAARQFQRDSGSGTVRYRFGSAISVITANPDMTMVGVAGRDVLKVLRVGESVVEEVVNLRAAIGSGMKGSSLGCTDMKWGNAYLSERITGLDDQVMGGLKDLRAKSVCKATFEGKAEGVRDVQFNPSPSQDNYFIAAFENGSIQKWDIRKPVEALRRLGGHSGQALTVDWNPDGKMVATAGRDKIIKVWDTTSESRKPRHHIQTSAHVARVRWRPTTVVGGQFVDMWSQQVASSALLNDARVLVWDLARPFVPEWAVEEHDGLITDRFFIRQDLSRVGYSPSSTLNSSALAWNVFGDITLASPTCPSPPLLKTTPPSPLVVEEPTPYSIPAPTTLSTFTTDVLNLTRERLSASAAQPPTAPPQPPRRPTTPTPVVTVPTSTVQGKTGGLMDVKQGVGPPRQVAGVFETGTLDWEAFVRLAKTYVVQAIDGDVAGACEKNAEYQTAQTWRMIQAMCVADAAADEPRNLTKVFAETIGGGRKMSKKGSERASPETDQQIETITSSPASQIRQQLPHDPPLQIRPFAQPDPPISRPNAPASVDSSSASASPIPVNLTDPYLIDDNETPKQGTVEALKPLDSANTEDGQISPFSTPRLTGPDLRRVNTAPGRITPETTAEVIPKTPLQTGDDEEDDDEDDDYRIHHDTLRAARWGSRWAGGLQLFSNTKSSIRVKQEKPVASVQPQQQKPKRLLSDESVEESPGAVDFMLGDEEDDEDEYEDENDDDDNGVRRLMGLGVAGMTSRDPMARHYGPSFDSEDDGGAALGRISQAAIYHNHQGHPHYHPRRTMSDPATGLYDSFLRPSTAYDEHSRRLLGGEMRMDVVVPGFDWKAAIRRIIRGFAEMGDVQMCACVAVLVGGIVEFPAGVVELFPMRQQRDGYARAVGRFCRALYGENLVLGNVMSQ